MLCVLGHLLAKDTNLQASYLCWELDVSISRTTGSFILTGEIFKHGAVLFKKAFSFLKVCPCWLWNICVSGMIDSWNVLKLYVLLYWDIIYGSLGSCAQTMWSLCFFNTESVSRVNIFIQQEFFSKVEKCKTSLNALVVFTPTLCSPVRM